MARRNGLVVRVNFNVLEVVGSNLGPAVETIYANQQITKENVQWNKIDLLFLFTLTNLDFENRIAALGKQISRTGTLSQK